MLHYRGEGMLVGDSCDTSDPEQLVLKDICDLVLFADGDNSLTGAIRSRKFVKLKLLVSGSRRIKKSWCNSIDAGVRFSGSLTKHSMYRKSSKFFGRLLGGVGTALDSEMMRYASTIFSISESHHGRRAVHISRIQQPRDQTSWAHARVYAIASRFFDSTRTRD
jgi:hypothetical protein